MLLLFLLYHVGMVLSGYFWEIVMTFSSNFFVDVESAKEPIEFNDDGHQIIKDDLRMAYQNMCNFLDYLDTLIEISREKGLTIEYMVRLMSSTSKPRMNYLGWELEPGHLTLLKVMFDIK